MNTGLLYSFTSVIPLEVLRKSPNGLSTVFVLIQSCFDLGRNVMEKELQISGCLMLCVVHNLEDMRCSSNELFFISKMFV